MATEAQKEAATEGLADAREIFVDICTTCNDFAHSIEPKDYARLIDRLTKFAATMGPEWITWSSPIPRSSHEQIRTETHTPESGVYRLQ
jgi:hypothetical protein